MTFVYPDYKKNSIYNLAVKLSDSLGIYKMGGTALALSPVFAVNAKIQPVSNFDYIYAFELFPELYIAYDCP